MDFVYEWYQYYHAINVSCVIEKKIIKCIRNLKHILEKNLSFDNSAEF